MTLDPKKLEDISDLFPFDLRQGDAVQYADPHTRQMVNTSACWLVSSGTERSAHKLRRKMEQLNALPEYLTDLEARAARADELAAYNYELQSLLHDHGEIIKARDAEIAALKAELARLEQQNAELATENKRLRNYLPELTSIEGGQP